MPRRPFSEGSRGEDRTAGGGLSCVGLGEDGSTDLASNLLDPAARAQQPVHTDFSPMIWDWDAEGVKGTASRLEQLCVHALLVQLYAPHLVTEGELPPAPATKGFGGGAKSGGPSADAVRAPVWLGKDYRLQCQPGGEPGITKGSWQRGHWRTLSPLTGFSRAHTAGQSAASKGRICSGVVAVTRDKQRQEPIVSLSGPQRAMHSRSPCAVNRRSILFCSAQRDELDLLAAQLDLELIAGRQPQLGGVGLAHHQVAVELHPGGLAEAPALRAPAAASSNAVAQVHPLGIQQCLIEGGEVEALAAILLAAHVAAAAHKIRFAGLAELLDLAEQLGAGKHGVMAK